jgi:hypothetical protein
MIKEGMEVGWADSRELGQLLSSRLKFENAYSDEPLAQFAVGIG